jgi:hypothetical protein
MMNGPFILLLLGEVIMTELLSIEDKIELAETASNVAVEQLEEFCVERGLPLQDVTSWSTAWETGGKLAVQAMVVQWSPARKVQREWHEDIKNAVKAFRPRRMRVTVEDNRYTVDEVKPLTAKNIVYTPLFQLRAVEEGSQLHWFLYWRRADGTFWPFAGGHRFEDVKSAVAEVIADTHYCFKLHPLH